MQGIDTRGGNTARQHRNDGENESENAFIRVIYWLIVTIFSLKVIFFVLAVTFTLVVGVDVYNWVIRHAFVYAANYCWKNKLIDLSFAMATDIYHVGVAAAVVQSKLDIAALTAKIEGLQAELRGKCPSECLNDCGKCPCECAPPVDCGRSGWTSAADTARIAGEFALKIAAGEAKLLLMQGKANEKIEDCQSKLKTCNDECEEESEEEEEPPPSEKTERAYFTYECPEKEPTNCTIGVLTCDCESKMEGMEREFNRSREEIFSAFNTTFYGFFTEHVRNVSEIILEGKRQSPSEYLNILNWVRGSGLAVVMLNPALFTEPLSTLIDMLAKKGIAYEFVRAHSNYLLGATQMTFTHEMVMTFLREVLVATA